MVTTPLTLKGVIDVEDDDNEGLLRQWRREKQQLEDEARALRTELGEVTAERDKLRASVGILRRQLSPLHHALRAVFGEIELAVGEEEFAAPQPGASPATTTPGSDSRWESYKQNFPGTAARIIDALLAHPEMNLVQLSALLKCSYDTAKGAAQKLLKVGALVRNGKMLRLNR